MNTAFETMRARLMECLDDYKTMTRARDAKTNERVIKSAWFLKRAAEELEER